MHSVPEKFSTIFELAQNWTQGLLGVGDGCVEAHLLYPKSCGTIRHGTGEMIAYFDEGTTLRSRQGH